MLDFWTDASKHTLIHESRIRDGELEFRRRCTCGYAGIAAPLPDFVMTCPILDYLTTRADRLRDTHPEWKAAKT